MKSEMQNLLSKLRKENGNIEISLKNIKDDFFPKFFKSDLDKIIFIEKSGKNFIINGEMFKPTKNGRHNTDIVIKKKFDINKWRNEYL